MTDPRSQSITVQGPQAREDGWPLGADEGREIDSPPEASRQRENT